MGHYRWLFLGLAAAGVILYLASKAGSPVTTAGPERRDSPHRDAKSQADRRNEKEFDSLETVRNSGRVDFKNSGDAWDAAVRNGSLMEQVRIIAELSKLDSGKAIDFILAKTSPGSVRNQLLKTCFMAAGDNVEEAFSKAAKLEPGKESASARDGISQRLGTNRALLDEAYRLLPRLAPDEIATVGAGVGKLNSAQTAAGPDNLKALESDLTKMAAVLDPAQKEAFLKEFAASYSNPGASVMSVLPGLEPLLEGLSQSSRDIIEITLGNQMVAVDPQQAIESLVSNRSSPEVIEKSMAQWIYRDITQADEWFQGNRNNLSAPYQDTISGEFADALLRKGDIEAARKWTGSILDAGRRETAMNELNQYWALHSKDILDQKPGKH